MPKSIDRVTVSILDKDFQVACPPEEKSALLHAAQEMDERMRKIRNSSGIVGLDRIAVMVGLNLCHELQSLRNQSSEQDGNTEELKKLLEKLDGALKP